LNSYELQYIIDEKLEAIKEQLREPTYFYTLDHDELSQNIDTLDLNQIRKMLSKDSVLEHYSAQHNRKQGRNKVLNAIAIGLLKGTLFFMLLPITGGCINPGVGLVYSLF